MKKSKSNKTKPKPKPKQVQIRRLNKTREQVERKLGKIKTDAQKLEARIRRRESEGLSAKFLEKLLHDKRKATRSIKHRLRSIDRKLDVLRASPGINGLFLLLKNFVKNILSRQL